MKTPHFSILDKNSSIFLFSGIAIWCASVLGIEHFIYQFLFCSIGLVVMGVPFDGTKKFLDKSDQFGYATIALVIFVTIVYYFLTQTWDINIIFALIFGIVEVAIVDRLISDRISKRKKTGLNFNSKV